MIRYYALASGIVLGIALLVAAWFERDLIRIKLASVAIPVPPKVGRERIYRGAAGRAFRGVAPWALSALPDCFTPLAHVTGSSAYVTAHLPSGARVVVPPARLAYGRCTIFLAGVEAIVTRGSDRLRIPPTVRFYRIPGKIAVWRSDAAGNDLRIYATHPAIP